MNQKICDALRNLVSFVQFKKCAKHPWRSVSFSPYEKELGQDIRFTNLWLNELQVYYNFITSLFTGL